MENMAKALKEMNARVEKAKKQRERTTKELDRFRPKNKIIRKALLSTKGRFEADHVRLLSPTCLWIIGGVECHGEKDQASLEELGKHVRDVHLEPLKLDQIVVQPLHRQYRCGWKGCSKKPFIAYRNFVKHVLRDHVGDKDQLTVFEAAVLFRYQSKSKAECPPVQQCNEIAIQSTLSQGKNEKGSSRHYRGKERERFRQHHCHQ